MPAAGERQPRGRLSCAPGGGSLAGGRRRPWCCRRCSRWWSRWCWCSACLSSCPGCSGEERGGRAGLRGAARPPPAITIPVSTAEVGAVAAPEAALGLGFRAGAAGSRPLPGAGLRGAPGAAKGCASARLPLAGGAGCSAGPAKGGPWRAAPGWRVGPHLLPSAFHAGTTPLLYSSFLLHYGFDSRLCCLKKIASKCR